MAPATGTIHTHIDIRTSYLSRRHTQTVLSIRSTWTLQPTCQTSPPRQLGQQICNCCRIQTSRTVGDRNSAASKRRSTDCGVFWAMGHLLHFMSRSASRASIKPMLLLHFRGTLFGNVRKLPEFLDRSEQGSNHVFFFVSVGRNRWASLLLWLHKEHF